MIPSQKYRIDPRDLVPNIAIGIALPFNGPAVFNQTHSTKEQTKFNLINLLLTNQGERIENPEFGTNIRSFLFEVISDDNIDAMKASIVSSISIYIPDIIVTSIEHESSEDTNTVSLQIYYTLKLSGSTDNIIIQFE